MSNNPNNNTNNSDNSSNNAGNAQNMQPNGQPDQDMGQQNMNQQGMNQQNMPPQQFNQGMNNGQMMNLNMQMRPPKPPKQPMDPAKKKKIILAVVLSLLAVVLVVVAVIVIIILTKVDYGETYRTAKEARPLVEDFAEGGSCSDVTGSVTSTYVTIEEYSKYVEGCRTWGDGVMDAVNKIGNTSAIKKDSEIKEQYDKFRSGVESVLPNEDELSQKLAMNEAWHKFEYLLDDLSADSTDAELQAAANALINSGNDILKTYGEGWLEKTLDYAHKYQAYWNASYNDPNKSALREASEAARVEQRTWVNANKPDIKTLADIDLTNVAKVETEFDKLYRMIVKRYEENYDSESGDCLEFLGEVTCN